MVNQAPIDTHSIALLAQKYYGETPHAIRPLASATNYVYLLKFRQYPAKVIKVFKRHDNAIQKELYFYKFLSQKNIPVPQVEHFDVTQSVIPHSWLSMNALGRSLHKIYWNRGYRYLGQAILKRLFISAGETFANIHNIHADELQAVDTEIYVRNSRADLEKQLISYINQLAEKNRLDQSTISKVENLFSKLQDSKEISLCHLDFAPAQLLVNRFRISGVIDWESSCFFNPVYDFAKCELKLKLKYNLADAFRQGYLRMRTLPDNYEEIKKPYQLVAVLRMLKSLPESCEQYSTYQTLLQELLTQA